MDLPFHIVVSEEVTHPYHLPAIAGERIRLGGETISFQPLISLFGRELTSELLDRFARCYLRGEFRQLTAHGRVLRNFLVVTATEAALGPSSPYYKLYRAMVDRAPISSDALVAALVETLGRLASLDDTSVVPTRNYSSRRSFVGCLRIVARSLANDGYWPTLPKITSSIGASRDKVSWASLGELQPDGGADSETLSASTVLSRNRSRSSALRAALAIAFDEEWQAYLEGRRLLALPDLPTLETLQAAVALLPDDYGRQRARSPPPVVASCFPDDDAEYRKASLLKYLVNIGQPKSALTSSDPNGGWCHLIKHCGGLIALTRMYRPNPRALAAAHTIVLLDTGFNVQPCDDLAADPFRLKAKRGEQKLVTVTSWKARAKGSPTASVLADYEASVPIETRTADPSCVEVIRRWQEMTNALRSHAASIGNPCHQYLWIIAKSTNPWEAFRPNTFHPWNSLRRELSVTPGLLGLHIRRPNLRATHLQMRLNDGTLDVAVAALVAGHKSQATTVRHYLNRGWFQSEMDEAIRRFQRLFEARLCADNPRAATALGVSHKELGERNETAIATGLGFACVDPLAGYQQGSRIGQFCTKIEGCADCDLLRFAPSPEAFRALALTEISLETAQDEFIARAPERWHRAWLPLLALCKATSSRLLESHRSRGYLAARQSTLDDVGAGRISMIAPW